MIFLLILGWDKTRVKAYNVHMNWNNNNDL